MDEKFVENVTRSISQRIERAKKMIPVGVSNRHIHVSPGDWEVLFGRGTKPKEISSLRQPGEFACEETVTLQGPRGSLENVRVVGPLRSRTQVEILKTNAAVLGVRPPLRDSGDIGGSAGLKVIGPRGALDLKEGVILAWRHLHFSARQAKEFGVRNGEHVRVRAGIGGDRELVFEKVLCRVKDNYELEFHVDQEEANASFIKTGDMVHVV